MNNINIKNKNMDIFNLFTQYHETAFQEFKKDLINSIKLDILNMNKNNKHICGHKRTQNRGYCRRLCEGNACKYHLKYAETNDENNIFKNNIEIINNFVLKSDVSDASEYVNTHKDTYKNIYENIISKDVLLNIKILELPKSNITLKYNLKELDEDINNYIFNLNSKINIFKSLSCFIILYNKIKRNRERKRLKNKRKKERRKARLCQTPVSVTNSNLNKPMNGVLLKENDKYYTINFYDEKVIADNIDGIECFYCGSVRYTNSGPCLYPDCYNRKFEDTEFKIYYEKNKKHKQSIYNPFLNNKK
jgi:hypothetical protein